MYNNYSFGRNFFILLVLITFFIPSIHGDIISVNAGGSGEIVVGPDRYIEGFFFANLICGDGLLELGEQCDDGNTVSGDGCSSTCQTEVAEPPPGGGGAAVNIALNPTKFNIDLVISTTKEETISVTNLETSEIIISVSQQGLDNHIILGASSLTIPAGQTVILDVVFVALSEPDIFVGKIIIGGKTILVTLNVKTKLLLFDSNIVVLNKDFKVGQGDDLETFVTLIPLGDPERLDVTLEFTIKDFNNKVYLTKSETLLIERQTDLRRDFDTGSLPLGDYSIGLVLRYSGGVAPSSASFEVVERVPLGIFGRLVLFLLILILIILIFIVIVLMRKVIEKRKANLPAQGN